MNFSVVCHLMRLLGIFGFLSWPPKSHLITYFRWIYKFAITISCLWPLAISGTLVIWNLYNKSPFGILCINAELLVWMTWSIVIQITLLKLALKNKIDTIRPVLKSKRLSLTLLMTTVVLIVAKSVSMFVNYNDILKSFVKPDLPKVELMIVYCFPFCIWHTIACVTMIYYQCAWFGIWADKLETFAEKLHASKAWRTNSKLLENLCEEYQALCKSVEEFSSDFEVMNSVGIMALFLNASFTGYFLLIHPQLTEIFYRNIVQYFVTSLVVILILLSSFFIGVHHLNKKVIFFQDIFIFFSF